jgi:hypothetical protein
MGDGVPIGAIGAWNPAGTAALRPKATFNASLRAILEQVLLYYFVRSLGYYWLGQAALYSIRIPHEWPFVQDDYPLLQ